MMLCITFLNSTLSKSRSYSFPPCFPRFLLLRVGRNKQLLDKDCLSYDVTREKCHNFKALARDFSFYNSFEHLLISGNKNEKEEKKLLKQQTAKENWLHLTDMNVRKANFICVGVDAIPALKENLAQSNIYENQLAKYVNTENCRVAVLNSFPIFLYDYFRNIANLC
ncbi:hypothetical protein [Bacteroides uniformis]|uniref:hypothetical protein n=1 Tax=Bacteroides uniformis TaxID=820 RepID=UPI00232AB2CD|nr:hypothetical protein [Bacteroides uniformis]MDC1817852.1 hypothetical protein [Bacteroides uniformis]